MGTESSVASILLCARLANAASRFLISRPMQRFLARARDTIAMSSRNKLRLEPNYMTTRMLEGLGSWSFGNGSKNWIRIYQSRRTFQNNVGMAMMRLVGRMSRKSTTLRLYIWAGRSLHLSCTWNLDTTYEITRRTKGPEHYCWLHAAVAKAQQ